MYRLNRCKSANRLVALLRRHSHADAAGTKNFASVAKVSDGHKNYERKMLPPELSRNVVKLQCGVCEVHLVGTGAYSDSWRQVEGVVQFLKPQVVFLEMCPSRDHCPTGQKVKVPTIGEMIDMVAENRNPLWSLCRCYFSKNGPQLEVNNDFRVAYEEALRYGGKVILGNRPREITFSRYLAKISLLEIISEFRRLRLHFDENLKKDDMRVVRIVVQLMNDLYPAFTETFIHECDQYMSAKLLEVAREHNTVVAVVDMAHLQGIQKHWKEPVDMKQLHNVPMAKNASNMILRWWFEKN